jgi:hypothetical protein
MMLGGAVPTSLTAWHTATLLHETAVNGPTPEGSGSATQVVPALTVPMMMGVRKMLNPTAVQSEAVGHEIALRPSTADGIDCAVHAYPPLTEARTEFTPTAKQSKVLGHEAEFSELVPAGGFCDVQDKPPVVVDMIVEPAAGLPLSPTAMQSSAAEQEIPVRSTALGGGLCDDHTEPAFEVPTTYGVELRLVTTATQVV